MYKKVLFCNKIILGNILCIWSNNYEKNCKKNNVCGFFWRFKKCICWKYLMIVEMMCVVM